MTARYKALRLINRMAVQPLHRWRRGMTLGARTAVIDGQGRFLLVRHTYAPGWIFPGGGVEFGETCAAAAIRELREEADVIATGPVSLHGIFSNHKSFRGDHLAFYVLREFTWNGFSPTREIAEAAFFAPDKLPTDCLDSSRRRISEILGHSAISLEW